MVGYYCVLNKTHYYNTLDEAVQCAAFIDFQPFTIFPTRHLHVYKNPGKDAEGGYLMCRLMVSAPVKCYGGKLGRGFPLHPSTRRRVTLAHS